MSSPEVLRTLGSAITIDKIDNCDDDQVILSTRVHRMKNLEELTEYPQDIHLYTPRTKMKCISLGAEYDNCSAMEKHVLGCVACIDETHTQGCSIKNAIKDAGPPPLHEVKLNKLLTNRKTIVEGYTFISPRLTRTEAFQKTCRDVTEHDFDKIQHWSAITSRAGIERGRINRFIKSTCHNCLVSKACHNEYSDINRKDIKYC